MNSQFLIAAPYSGSGKTTVTLGLLRAFRRKGLSVQPFKCGPDFIDPIHHRTAAGRDSINLDRYMMSDDHIRHLYRHYSSSAGVSITEGVMGLFDGAPKSQGSSADLARLLDLPVILVLNASAMAYSAAPLLYGLANFDRSLRVAGVIFNLVDSAGHYQLLCEACADVGITPLGHLPAHDGLRIPERHLGLDTTSAEAAIDIAADHIEQYIDLESLLKITQTSSITPTTATTPSIRQTRQILIARDAAFHFLYPENIRRLEEWGPVSWFSPLSDTQLPFFPDLLYLPGGYPELFLKELSNNDSMRRAIHTYAAAGGRIIAECGGMMYLGQGILDPSGRTWPMAGVLGLTTSMQHKRLTIGYRTARIGEQTIKGHEFHYSQAIEGTPPFYGRGVIATYAHFYWGEDTRFLENLFNSDGYR